jgi:non-heme chloroperoxidase
MNARRFVTPGGMTIAADECGPPGRDAVMLLHGGGQTRHSWGAALASLERAGYHAVSLDLRGHGDSGWSPEGDYGLDAHLRDLRAVIDQLGGKPALVGASLGGLTSLLAVGESEADRVGALVLIDIVPNYERNGTAEIVNFMSTRARGFASIEEAADAVAAYLPSRKRPRDISGLAKNLRLNGDGRYYWHWDPLIMDARRNPQVSRPRLEQAARRVAVPCLLIRGGLSRIVSADAAADFQRLVPHAEVVTVDQAGHMVAGDANDAFDSPLLDFLDRTLGNPC